MKRSNAKWEKPVTRLGKPPLIHRTLDISTLHITQEDMAHMESGDQQTICAYKYEFGMFVIVPDLKDFPGTEVLPEPWSKQLSNVIQFARKLKCTWIKLDQDGDVYPEDILEHCKWP